MARGFGIARPRAYGHMFHVGAATVPVGGDVIFSECEVLKGLSFTPGTANVGIGASNDYVVLFVVAGVASNQFGVAVNGVVVMSTVFGSGAGTQPNAGQAIVSLVAGDLLSLRNTTGSGVELQGFAGGTLANVSASLVVSECVG